MDEEIEFVFPYGCSSANANDGKKPRQIIEHVTRADDSDSSSIVFQVID